MGKFNNKILEDINYKSIIIDFPILTSGILTGAVLGSVRMVFLLEMGYKEMLSPTTWIYMCSFFM